MRNWRSPALIFANIVFLSAVAAEPAKAPICPDCAKETAVAVAGAELLYESAWIDAGKRKNSIPKNFTFKNQDNEPVSAESLCGKPLVITFLYTRCSNAKKCPLSAATFARLEVLLKQQDLLQKVRLAIVTFDPEYDSPTILHSYGKEKGVTFSPEVMMLQPDIKQKTALFDALELPVNFSNGRVNIHGIELILLDSKGQVAKTYKTVIWDNDKVVKDIQKLILETPDMTVQPEKSEPLQASTKRN